MAEPSRGPSSDSLSEDASHHDFWGPLERELRRPSDPVIVEATEDGERFVGRVRLGVVAILATIQAVPQDSREHVVGLVFSGAAVLLSLLIVLAHRRYRPWMATASCVLDVSLVSAMLFSFLLIGRPHTAVNSKVTFELYFIAIAAAGLRYNWRLCALSGGLAVGQYALLVAVTDWLFDLQDPAYAPFEYGMFSWAAQVARLLILAVAGLVSTTIAVRSQRQRRLAHTDRLTGLLNRRSLDGRLIEEGSRSLRYNRPLAIALVDVDHFKRFNDTYGHGAGDKALRSVSRLLRDTLRRTDVVGRFGGEEFLLLLPETSSADALPLLDRVRALTAVARLEVGGDGRAAGVTVSIGLAGVPADGRDVEAVLAIADARLYEAKARGRNAVVGPPADAQAPG